MGSRPFGSGPVRLARQVLEGAVVDHADLVRVDVEVDDEPLAPVVRVDDDVGPTAS